MTAHVAVTRTQPTLADLRSLLAEASRLGLPDDTQLHGKIKVDWKSKHGARIVEITAAGDASAGSARADAEVTR